MQTVLRSLVVGLALPGLMVACTSPDPDSGAASRWFTQASASNPIDESEHLADLAASVSPAVISISVQGPVVQSAFPFQSPQQREGLGSGVLISADGVALTNHHVVEGAQEIVVVLTDGRRFRADVVGSDAPTDLAVIRLRGAAGLPALSLGDSDELRAGELVLAIGNPFGLSSSVSMGIVSATGRTGMGITEYEDFIQTDAAINPGNSGGALVDMRGDLVGINTAILSRTGGSAGVGFAIPSSMVERVTQAIMADGRVRRGWLGVAIGDRPIPDQSDGLGVAEPGAVVRDVEPGSPAAQGGLLPNDIVVAVAGETIRSANELRYRVADELVGETVAFDVLRAGAETRVNVTLGERPDPRSIRPAAASGLDPKLPQ
jgi:serine protease Do